MEGYLKGRRHPVEVAKDVLKTRFPEALFGFTAGSFQRGEATASSDIDLVIICKKLDFAWRESFLFEAWPVEAFVHDPDTLNYFFQEIDGKDGTPSLPNMVFEGTVVPTESELSLKLKKNAEQFLAGSPAPWSTETIYHQRYGLTDLVDDLRAPRNELEAYITIGAIQEMLGNFYFRSQNLWSASRKHIPRRVKKVDPQMGKRWAQSFEDAYKGQHALLIKLVQDILEPHGGLLFDTYKRDAPKEWRLPMQSSSDSQK